MQIGLEFPSGPAAGQAAGPKVKLSRLCYCRMDRSERRAIRDPSRQRRGIDQAVQLLIVENVVHVELDKLIVSPAFPLVFREQINKQLRRRIGDDRLASGVDLDLAGPMGDAREEFLL